MEELLEESMRNIDKLNKDQEIKKQTYVLEEAIQEIKIAKDLVSKFTDIRNKAIKNLYNVGVSAKELSDMTGISKVYIHRVVK